MLQDAYEDDLEEMQTKTDKIKPKSFPYTFYIMDDKQEKAYDEAIFSNYRGSVFWNDCGRDFIVDPNQPKENFEPENMHKLVYTSLKPLKIYAGGEKALTARSLCEGVAKVGFNPGEHHFLENIQVQMREIDGEEVVTIVFYAGPEQWSENKIRNLSQIYKSTKHGTNTLLSNVILILQIDISKLTWQDFNNR